MHEANWYRGIHCNAFPDKKGISHIMPNLVAMIRNATKSS